MIGQSIVARGTHFAWVLRGSSIMKRALPAAPAVAFVSNAETGYLSLELTAHGEGGHAARPSRDLARRVCPCDSPMSVGQSFESDLDEQQGAEIRGAGAARSLRRPVQACQSLANKAARAQAGWRRCRIRRRFWHTTISPLFECGLRKRHPADGARHHHFRLHQRDTISSLPPM